MQGVALGSRSLKVEERQGGVGVARGRHPRPSRQVTLSRRSHVVFRPECVAEEERGLSLSSTGTETKNDRISVSFRSQERS